jgi:hypothetical protein
MNRPALKTSEVRAVNCARRIPFASTCPRCRSDSIQWYSHLALFTRLRRGDPVEGYCVMCRECWQLSSNECHALAQELLG